MAAYIAAMTSSSKVIIGQNQICIAKIELYFVNWLLGKRLSDQFGDVNG